MPLSTFSTRNEVVNLIARLEVAVRGMATSLGSSEVADLTLTSARAFDAALKEVLADKAVQEKMLNAGVIASYQDSRAMTARVEQDRKLTQTLFGH